MKVSVPIRPLSRLGGPGPPVGPAGPVLDPLQRHPPLKLLAGLEGSGRHAHQPGPDLRIQEQPRPLQVGGQPQTGLGREGGRLGVRGGHQPERGGGETRGRDGVSAGSSSVESLPDGGAGVRGLWGRNRTVLTGHLTFNPLHGKCPQPPLITHAL